MQKIIDVVAAIIERDGEILLAQRPPHADQPGLWEFAGGKVEHGVSARTGRGVGYRCEANPLYRQPSTGSLRTFDPPACLVDWRV